MYVCNCHGITEAQVREKASSSCFAFAHYSTQCRSGGCCKCLPKVKEIVNEEYEKAVKLNNGTS